MPENIIIDKCVIEDFLKKEFDGHEYCIGDGYWYVHVDKELDWRLHYEYNYGQVHLDIEGYDWRPARNFLRERLSKHNKLSAQKWGRIDCRWTLQGVPQTWEEIKQAFKDLDFIVRPYILAWKKAIETQEEQVESKDDFKVFSRFQNVVAMLNKQLEIPNYQRPYVWTQKNVEQLLSDINNARANGKLQYLIGSVILHRPETDKERFHIVDGQQRLTTICLILKALDYKDGIPILKFNHAESFRHIKENYEYIRQWLDRNLSKSAYEDFIKYITDACCFVEITVIELAEAFQLFETQNGRGKELEAYNLLKAFHIRAMSEDSHEDKRQCDVRWENAAMYADRDNIRYDLLRQIINEHLYRIRQWSRGFNAGRFSKKEVDEFKGLTIGKTGTLDYAYQNIMLQQLIAQGYMRTMNQGLFKVKERFEYGDPDNMNPFVSVNQLVINGGAFFDYIETYVEAYKRLFVDVDSSQLADFKSFYKDKCKNYPGSHRTGDGYVRQVYKSAIILLFDRFGEIGVNEIYKELYTVIYWTRLSKHQVRYLTMTKKENGGWVFPLINQAKSLSDLLPIKVKANNIKTELENEKYPFKVSVIESVIKSI